MDTGGRESRLQKRNVNYSPESAEGALGGRSEKRTRTNKVAQTGTKTLIQLKEALQLQLDVQRRILEQLEAQRGSQLRIEEQGKQLKMMFDQQKKSAQNLMESTNSSSKHPNHLSPTLEDPEVLFPEGSDDNGFPVRMN